MLNNTSVKCLYGEKLGFLVKRSRETLQNYKAIIKDNNNSVLFVYMSSNAIYFPDTVREFQRTIVREDRYEWENFHSKYYKEYNALFLRDNSKLFYQYGINERLDNIDKIADLIKTYSSGSQTVIMVGVSSGGHAILHLIQKIAAFSIIIGAQYNLSYLKHSKVGQYFPNLANVNVNASSVKYKPIGYFSILNSLDLHQMFLSINRCKIRYVISRSHGATPRNRIRDDINKILLQNLK